MKICLLLFGVVTTILTAHADWRTAFDDIYFAHSSTNTPVGSTNILAHWLMNDNSASTTVAENNGNYPGNSQTNTDTMHVSGKINGALNFNGSTDYITIGTGEPWDSLCSGTNPVTYACWHYSPNCSDRGFVSKGNDPYWNIFGMLQYGECLTFGIKNGSDGNCLAVCSDYIGSSRVETWTHYAATYNGSQTPAGVVLYINGVEDVNRWTWLEGLSGTWSNAQPVKIGYGYGGASSECEGYLDDIRIYNRVLTSNEIASIYNNGSGTESD